MKLMYYFNTDNRLRNLFAQTWKILMYALTYFPIISLIIFCLTDFKLVIILQFALILIYVFNYKNRFNKFRVFLTKSTKSLAFMNAWDGIFCGILTYILYNLNLVESTLINLSQYFFTNYGISKNHINNWLIIVILLILPLVLSVIKTIISIKIFKKVNKIDISKGKTLWNVYATMLINSFLWYYIYIYYFISKAIDFHSDLITDIFIFNSFIALYLIFWWIIHNLIRHGAKDTKEVIASWLTGTICILLLAIFNQVENELINALTWFCQY